MRFGVRSEAGTFCSCTRHFFFRLCVVTSKHKGWGEEGDVFSIAAQA